MGNKLGRRRQAVDEKFTRPQGLYQHRDVDHKKLRKLILDSKLSPCYPGDEECGYDLEECPICFLYYPSLNRSRCCMKGICTECFLQMKTPNSTRPTQYPCSYELCFYILVDNFTYFIFGCLCFCLSKFHVLYPVFLNCKRCPFCKTSNYAVEYRGVKTKEEKGMEQIEEQRVIEAKIRMRQQELQDEEDRMLKRQETSSSSRTMAPEEVGYSVVAGEEIVSSQEPCPSIRQPLHPRMSRDGEFDLDLEDIMVMEAIWLSIQENGRQRNPTYVDSIASEQYMTEVQYSSPAIPPVAESSSSPSGGLACAIAALAERQQTGGESSGNYNGNMSTVAALPGCSMFSNRGQQEGDGYPPAGSSGEISADSQLTMTRDDGEWGVDHSEVAEVGTSCGGSAAVEDAGRIAALPPQHEIEGGFQTVGGPIVPESFEEQMMLAMAVSLAEARARTSAPGVAWQ